MIVVGSSLARAFGIVGAAGLVRYRAKIDDPKGRRRDAAARWPSGWPAAWACTAWRCFATVFIVAVLWVIESFEPKPRKVFMLEIKAKEAAKLQPKVEALLRRRRVHYELREVKPEEFSYHVELPMDVKTDGSRPRSSRSIRTKAPASNGKPRKKKPT